MAKWLVVRNGQEYGPVDKSQLKELAASGRLQPDDLLRRTDGSGERLAKDVAGLLHSQPLVASQSLQANDSVKKRKIPWVTIIILVGLSMSVARLLNAVKNSRLRAGDGARQTTSIVARPKRHSFEPTLCRSGDQSSEVLTADFIPSRVGAKWTETHTLHKASNGKPDVQWQVACEQSGPGEITQRHNKIFPSKDGTERKKQELYSESESTVQTAIMQGNPTPEWVPLIYKGAHVGDSWRDEQSTWTLQSLDAQHGKTLAVIERYSEVVQGGTSTEIRTIYTVEKGVGILKLVRSFSVDGVPNPFPSYTEEREGQPVFSSSPPGPAKLAESEPSPERVQQAEGIRQPILQGQKASGNPTTSVPPNRTAKDGTGGKPPAVAVEAGNVAAASRGGSASEIWANREELLDGDEEGEPAHDGVGNPMTVTLAKTYELKRIKMKLWDEPERFYTYTIESSEDGVSFTPLVDRSKGQWKGWQVLDFSPRPVKAIRVTGLSDTRNVGFHVHELEAYCTQ
jgi:hypothetical protein